MKYCKSCGSQLPDSAVFCSKCGTRVELKPSSPQSRLSNWAVFVLSIVAAFILFCSLGCFFDKDWLGLIITLCASCAIFAVCFGVVDKKYAWAITLASLFVILFYAGVAGGDAEYEEQNETQTEQKKKTVEVNSNTSSNERIVPQAKVKQNKENRKKKIEKEGYQDGQSAKYNIQYLKNAESLIRAGNSVSMINGSMTNQGRIYYNNKYGEPTNAEEEELKELYARKFAEAFMTLFDN